MGGARGVATLLRHSMSCWEVCSSSGNEETLLCLPLAQWVSNTTMRLNTIPPHKRNASGTAVVASKRGEEEEEVKEEEEEGNKD